MDINFKRHTQDIHRKLNHCKGFVSLNQNKKLITKQCINNHYNVLLIFYMIKRDYFHSETKQELHALYMLVKDETSTLTVQHNGFGIFTACKEQMCAEVTTLNHKSTFHKKILKLCNQRVSVHE